jgi:hypothetical protein
MTTGMPTGTTPDAAVPPGDVDRRTTEAVRVADGFVAAGRAAVRETWGVVRFVIFLIYLVLGVIGFWVAAFAALLGVFRLALRVLRLITLWLSGGNPPPREGRAPTVAGAAQQELQRLWDQRLLLYADVARPVARHIVIARAAGRRFLHWAIVRKISAVAVTVCFVGLPLVYIIPRPHDVQITDDNALSHTDGDLKYVIHALNLDDPTETLEYENEYALHLGKINPQGLKAQLQPGRYYRLWIVGIRWNYLPATLFPNILWATEIDANRNPVTGPALLGVPPAGETPQPPKD